ncbi:hypothetical protein BDR26DRAFT_935783 [Obelidium mucronatum]|nr:hypothetical protein BDR26DRAFT_935783 [Obelidium mucronatum]
MTKKLRAIANFDCAADTPQELSFKKGDVIIDVVAAPDEGNEWYSGRLQVSKVQGLFPGNYVRFVPVIESDDEDEDEEDEDAIIVSKPSPAASPSIASSNHSPMAAYKAAFKSSAKEKLLLAKEKAIPLAQKMQEKAQESKAKVSDRIKEYNN